MALLGSTLGVPQFKLARPHRFSPLCLERRACSFHWLFLILGFIQLGASSAQAQSKEYQIKAAFLYNFTQFVQWPDTAFPPGHTPFCIGILGDDPFDGSLDEMVRGEMIDHRPLVIRHASGFDGLKDCQIIFISKSEEGHVAEILSETSSSPVLMVSEIDGFDQEGGMINFYLQGGKVRFEINPSSAQKAGLKISSQLLTLGKIVRPQN